MPPSVLAFDIETIPDTAGLRRLHGLPESLNDSDVVAIAQRLRRQQRNNDFFPLHLQRVVVISCVLRQFDSHGDSEPLKIFSLPHTDKASEAEAIDLFYRLLDKYQPTIVSWNGGGFDLPVLQYRAMMQQQQAKTYWKEDGEFKWDNYTNRFHKRHTDLMDVLSLYQVRAAASLNDFAILCGLPGKIGPGGGGVWDAWQQGDIDGIRNYCENDALLTYLLYVRYQHFRGKLGGGNEAAFVRQHLQMDKARWGEFLAGWENDAP